MACLCITYFCITFAVLCDESNTISCASSVKSVPVINVQTLPTKISPSQYEAPLTGKKNLTIRGKAIKSIFQPKTPISNGKKEKNEDVIKSCIQQLSKSATEVAARMTRPMENTNTEELQFLHYLMKHVPEDKKLLCISNFCLIAEIYRKGSNPSIKEDI